MTRPKTSLPAPVGVALLGILEAIEDARIGLLTCLACGCLCLPAEHCPGCQSRALEAARG